MEFISSSFLLRVTQSRVSWRDSVWHRVYLRGRIVALVGGHVCIFDVMEAQVIMMFLKTQSKVGVSAPHSSTFLEHFKTSSPSLITFYWDEFMFRFSFFHSNIYINMWIWSAPKVITVTLYTSITGELCTFLLKRGRERENGLYSA